jgi:hypothetical protein
MFLFASVTIQEVLFFLTLYGFLVFIAASLVQLIVVWRRARALNAQLARMQEAITSRTIVQRAVYHRS